MEPEKVPKKGRVRHVHQDHESAYSNGRRSTLPDRHVFELAEVRENGKGYGKAHHSGTEKKSYPVNTGDTEYEKQSQKVHKQEEEDKRQLSLF